MPREIRKLGDLATLEVSLVTKGANRKVFALKKSAEEQDMKPIIEAVLKADLDGADKIAAILKREGFSEKGADAFTAIFKLAKGFEDELPKPEKLLKALAEACGVEIEKAFPFPKKDKDEKDEDEKDEELPPFLKAKMEKTKKSLDDTAAEVVALRKQLDDEREDRRTKEFVAKAATEYKALAGIPASDLGLVLKSVTDHAPDMVAKLETVLKVAAEAIAQGEVLRQAGVPGAGIGAGSAWTQIEKLADGIVQKSDKGVSRETAIDLVLKTAEGARLMEQYAKENPRQYAAQ